METAIMSAHNGTIARGSRSVASETPRQANEDQARVNAAINTGIPSGQYSAISPTRVINPAYSEQSPAAAPADFDS